MKIPASMWSVVLFKNRGDDEQLPSYEVFELSRTAKLKDFDHLEHEYCFTDTAWDLANALKEIDLETNKNLKEIFFKSWKEVAYDDKSRVFKNVDYQEYYEHGSKKFEKELKSYYLENMIQYPTVPELFRFRKDMSQDKLREALINIFQQTHFHDIKNQPNNKKDYWENHLTGKEADKLLDLLVLSSIKKEELTVVEDIGFFNISRQAKFDKLIDKELDIPLIESNDNQVYLLEVKVNNSMLLKTDNKLGSVFINTAWQYMSMLMEEALKLEKITNKNYMPLKLVAYGQENYDSAVIKREAVSNWMENNTILLIDKIKEVQNKDLVKMRLEAGKLASKILLKSKLEYNLVEKNTKTKHTNKI